MISCSTSSNNCLLFVVLPYYYYYDSQALVNMPIALHGWTLVINCPLPTTNQNRETQCTTSFFFYHTIILINNKRILTVLHFSMSVCILGFNTSITCSRYYGQQKTLFLFCFSFFFNTHTKQKPLWSPEKFTLLHF